MTEVLDNNNAGGLTVLKVYELAADVGKECQSLIELYGQDSASSVTLKIISILEHLELLVNEKTELEKRVACVSEDIVNCQNDLSRKSEQNLHLQEDLQRVEDQHYEDLEEWKELLSKARRETRDLKKRLNEKEGEVVQEKVQEQETLKVLLKLKETVDRQRDHIRANENELRSKNQDVEALQQQVERLAKVNSNLRRKQEVMETHSRHLIRQKSTLQGDVMVLNKNLNARQAVIMEGDDTDGGDKVSSEVDNKQDESQRRANLRDPNRPRFTLNELKTVLVERDEMHLKVVALEEELEEYRPKEEPTESPANVSISSRIEDTSGKNKPSGIRKFFANLFKGNKDTTVEDELKKWEMLDFETEGISPSETDPNNLSSSMSTTDGSLREGSSPALNSGPRRNSDTTPSGNNNNVSLEGSLNDSWFFRKKSRSSSATTEMVELTESSPKPRASSSPIRSRSSSPREQSPRSTLTSLKGQTCKSKDELSEVDDEQKGKGGSKETIPYVHYGSYLLSVNEMMGPPF